MKPDRIAQLLAEEEPETRRLAAQRIATVRGDEAATLLLCALGDVDWRVRKEATAVAPSIERREPVLRMLRAALDEKVNLGLRNAAVEAMVAIGSDALPAAIEAAQALDEGGRKLAVEVLAGIPDARGTRALALALADDDPNVRATAAEALGRAANAGEEARGIAIDALVALLGNGDTLAKLAALESLSRLDAELPWVTVGPFADDPILKRYALAAAATSREVDAVRALASAVGDPSGVVAHEAIVALGEIVLEGPSDVSLVTAAGDVLRASARAMNALRTVAVEDGASETPPRRGQHQEENVRARGAALVLLGAARQAEDVPLLVEAISDPALQSRAEVALQVFGEGARHPLLEAGRNAAPNVRGATLSLFPALAKTLDDGEVLAVMREALRDPSSDTLLAAIPVFGRSGSPDDIRAIAPFALHDDARVAAAAAAALGDLAARHEAVARALLSGLDTSRAEAVIGCIAIEAFARRAAAGADDVAFLQGALSSSDLRARRQAVVALATVAESSPREARAADAVAFALADEEPEVVLAAVRALGRLRRAEPLIALLEATRDPTTVAAALRALGEADRDRAFGVALPLVSSADSGVASAAVEALGSLQGPRRDDALFAALEHADKEVVKVALSELGRAMSARALTRVGLALDHQARDVRRLAAELLGTEASAPAHALLRARLEREKDIGVRVTIAAALSARTRGGEEPR